MARAYGVCVPETGRSRRALFVIDPEGVVRWSATFPDMLNPGADGVLSALEALRPVPAVVPELQAACERPHRTREEPDG